MNLSMAVGANKLALAQFIHGNPKALGERKLYLYVLKKGEE